MARSLDVPPALARHSSVETVRLVRELAAGVDLLAAVGVGVEATVGQ